MSQESPKKGASPQKKEAKTPQKGKGRSRRAPKAKPVDEFDQKIIDIARVTRVTAGGKRMKFRACVAVGDKKNRVGLGLAKGSDVTNAINKAVLQAKKNVITVPIINGTIPHAVQLKVGAAKLLVKPGRKGNGIKAGGVVKMILDISGIEDVVAKILGKNNNKINNAQAAIEALSRMQKVAEPKGKAAKKSGDKKSSTKSDGNSAKKIAEKK